MLSTKIKKTILTITLMVLFYAAKSQVPRPNGLPTVNSTGWYSLQSVKDSFKMYVLVDTFPAKYPTTIWHSNGNFYKTPGGTGSHWSLWIPSIFGPYLPISDTASMLAGYVPFYLKSVSSDIHLRPVIGSLNVYGKNSNGDITSGGFAASDITGFLGYYLKGDPNGLFIDTTGKMQISSHNNLPLKYKQLIAGVQPVFDDWSLITKKYARDSLGALKLNISDTASMLSHYARSQILGNYVSRFGQTNMVGVYTISGDINDITLTIQDSVNTNNAANVTPGVISVGANSGGTAMDSSGISVANSSPSYSHYGAEGIYVDGHTPGFSSARPYYIYYLHSTIGSPPATDTIFVKDPLGQNRTLAWTSDSTGKFIQNRNTGLLTLQENSKFYVDTGKATTLVAQENVIANGNLISTGTLNAGDGGGVSLKQGTGTLGTIGIGYSTIGAIDSTKLDFVLVQSSGFAKEAYFDFTRITTGTPVRYYAPDSTGTLALLSNVATKLSISDTAAMLVPYLRKSDTSNLVAPYLRKSDTLTMLNGRISSISLATPNVLYTTPVTFSRNSGAWSGTLSLNTQSANGIFAGPSSGSAALPTFRQIVNADITNATIDLTTKVTGILPVANGGTGSTVGAVLNQTAQQASSNFNISGAGVIGTTITSPVVLGGTAVSSSLILKSTTGIGSSDFIDLLVGNNGGTRAGRINTSGNWTIGGSNDAGFKLDVQGTLRSTGHVSIGASATSNGSLTIASDRSIGNQFVRLEDIGTNGKTYAIVNGAGGVAGKLSIFDVSANASRILIDSLGNVGIGALIPGATLDVNGTFRVNGTANIGGATTLSNLSSTGIVHNSSAGLLSTSLIVNADITNSTIDLTTKVTGLLPNANLANSSVTIGSTSISLGATTTTIAGLTALTSTTITGTLATAAQPNITSVGTLTSLTVSGRVVFSGLTTTTDTTTYKPFVIDASGNTRLFTNWGAIVGGSGVHGTYSPTVANISNTSGLSVSPAFYEGSGSTTGNIITVAFQVSGTCTSASQNAFSMTIPTGANFSSVAQCWGSGSGNNPSVITQNLGVEVTSINASNTVNMLFTVPVGVTNFSFKGTFTYQVQ